MLLIFQRDLILFLWLLFLLGADLCSAWLVCKLVTDVHVCCSVLVLVLHVNVALLALALALFIENDLLPNHPEGNIW